MQKIPWTDYSDIWSDSRKVTANSIFICLLGIRLNGHNFVRQAIEHGAGAIIYSEDLPADIVELADQTNVILYKIDPADTRHTLLEGLHTLYPIDLTCVAITGTDGKGSTAHYCRELMATMGFPSLSIGTSGVITSGLDTDMYTKSSPETTPDIVTNYQTLYQLQEQGVTHAFIEYSSIGIHQGRLDGVPWSGGVFTNFGTDHLTYHKTRDEYFYQKSRLFSEILSEDSFAIINQDIIDHRELVTRSKTVVLLSEPKIVFTPTGYQIRISDQMVSTPILAGFHMTNLWFALHVLEQLGFDKSRCIQNLDTITLYPAGRFEVFRNPDKPTVIVDYAHTPEGLQHVLSSANNIRPNSGRLIVVFGCGGGRDFEKRINMGRIASQMADYVYVTDDNPRDDDPADIRRMIISGMDEEFENYTEISDRSTAIRTAITEASSQDIVVIAGKGDEQSQTYGDKVLPFDDRDEVEKSLSLNT